MKHLRDLFSIAVCSTMMFLVQGCSKQQEALDIAATNDAKAAPTVVYEPVLISQERVGSVFAKHSIDGGNAIEYVSRAGVINVLEYVLESPDLSGYVAIEKAYQFGAKYLLVVSTGENGNSCPATTYVIAFDTKSESVTGQDRVDGCSEILEAFSEGNKLTVKKEGAAIVIYNADVKKPPRSPAVKLAKAEDTIAKVQPTMMGDVHDDNPNAAPRTIQDARDRKNKKTWQDNNGFIHYPDGSRSTGPVD